MSEPGKFPEFVTETVVIYMLYTGHIAAVYECQSWKRRQGEELWRRMAEIVTGHHIPLRGPGEALQTLVTSHYHSASYSIAMATAARHGVKWPWTQRGQISLRCAAQQIRDCMRTRRDTSHLINKAESPLQLQHTYLLTYRKQHAITGPRGAQTATDTSTGHRLMLFTYTTQTQDWRGMRVKNK